MSTMEEAGVIDLLCQVDLPEEKHDIVRAGEVKATLTVRGLTHDEALQLQEFSKKEDTTNAMYEQKMLSWALVYPKMSTGQIKAWQRSSAAAEIAEVVELVTRLSGMDKDAPKNAYKSVPGEPVAGE